MAIRKIHTEVILIIIIVSILLGFLLGFLSKEADKLSYPKKYGDTVGLYCEKYSVPEELVYSTIKIKSNFDNKLITDYSEYGLFQMSRETFNMISEKLGESNDVEVLLDPYTSIKYGTYYMQYLIAKYGSVELCSVALGYGENQLDVWLSTHKYTEGDYSIISSSTLKSYMNELNKTMEKYYDLY